jgi:hypothetical protein
MISARSGWRIFRRRAFERISPTVLSRRVVDEERRRLDLHAAAERRCQSSMPRLRPFLIF